MQIAHPDAIRCSNPLLTRERKIKTTLKHHLCPDRLAKLQGFNNGTGEVGEKLALPCFADEIKGPPRGGDVSIIGVPQAFIFWPINSMSRNLSYEVTGGKYGMAHKQDNSICVWQKTRKQSVPDAKSLLKMNSYIVTQGRKVQGQKTPTLCHSLPENTDARFVYVN